MWITSACLDAYAKSPVAPSPAHWLYAEIIDIPICIADHLEVLPPSQTLPTIDGILTACQTAPPTSAFKASACSSGNSLLMSNTNAESISSANSSSPVKTFT